MLLCVITYNMLFFFHLYVFHCCLELLLHLSTPNSPHPRLHFFSWDRRGYQTRRKQAKAPVAVFALSFPYLPSAWAELPNPSHSLILLLYKVPQTRVLVLWHVNKILFSFQEFRFHHSHICTYSFVLKLFRVGNHSVSCSCWQLVFFKTSKRAMFASFRRSKWKGELFSSIMILKRNKNERRRGFVCSGHK